MQYYLRDMYKIYQKGFWIGLADKVFKLNNLIFLLKNNSNNQLNGTLSWVDEHDNTFPDQWGPGQPLYMYFYNFKIF